MLLSKIVEVKWNSKIKKHYVGLGYTFTKMGDKFDVSVNDLTSGSGVFVDVKCDYCGKVYQKPWHRYITEHNDEVISKDCCNDCKKHKIVETSIAKYGVTSVLKLEDVQNKIKSTNIEKYGAENPFASEEIKTKIEQTNIEKYGFKSPLQNKDILSKVSNTCLERYGVKYYIQTQRFYRENNPHWKGGIGVLRNERATSDYINWRKDVFARDHYTCQCCGARSGEGVSVKLNAHHIMNWKDNPDLRYEINNGITLCEDCHYSFHSEHGKRFNNIQQLQSFIDNNGKKIC